MSSILFGDTRVPNIEYDYILLWGIVFCIRNIILLGSTTKKHYSHGQGARKCCGFATLHSSFVSWVAGDLRHDLLSVPQQDSTSMR